MRQCDDKTNQSSGKILRVKQGTNPNSSSVGSDIPTFLGLAASLGGVSAVVMQVFRNVHGRIQEKKDKSRPLAGLAQDAKAQRKD